MKVVLIIEKKTDITACSNILETDEKDESLFDDQIILLDRRLPQRVPVKKKFHIIGLLRKRGRICHELLKLHVISSIWKRNSI